MIYVPGPDVTRGQLFYENAANTTLMQIEFANLEPVFDAVFAATLRVHGTNSDNVIDYRPGGVAGHGRVTVDTYEAIHFTNKTNLILNGFAGSDTISLNNPFTPTGLTSITVNGGEPTAGSDTLIVNGTSGADTIGYNPSATMGAGSVTVNAAPPVNFTNTEAVVINGAGGTDALTYTTPGGYEVNYTPGAVPDAGLINASHQLVGPALVPLAFSNIGAFGSVTFATAVGRSDRLELNGTANSDVFEFQAVLPDTAQILQIGFGQVTVLLFTPGIGLMNLHGREGDDEFQITGSLPFGISIHGGDASAGHTAPRWARQPLLTFS